MSASAVRRSSPSVSTFAAPKAPVPHVLSYECDGCGAVHQSPDTEVPVGWTARRGHAWCTDCTTAGIPLRTIRGAC